MRLLKDITLPELDPTDQKVDRVAYRVAESHDVSIGRIKNGCRKHYLVDARQDLARKLHFKVGLSYSAIGRYMNRHHTTIMNYINRRSYR